MLPAKPPPSIPEGTQQLDKIFFCSYYVHSQTLFAEGLMDFPIRTIRLASDPREGGLWCGLEGLTLAGQPLLEKTGTGFAPPDASDIQNTLDRIFGETLSPDAAIYLPGLASVAGALNKGDLPLAMIGSVLLKLPDVAEAKRAYDDSEARNEIGRWTRDGAGEAKTPIAAEAEAATAVEASALAPETVGLLQRLARILPGPISFLTSVLIPTNESNIHYGKFPDFPGLHYRSDEGAVTISRLDATGNIETLYQGMPDKDGFYRDTQGLIIGRAVGTAALFDNVSLAEITNPPHSEPDSENNPQVTLAADDNEPKTCPPPTPENTNGRSERSLAYQSQITGLAEGWDVLFHGVRYDGCEAASKDMQEAKGIMGGYLIKLSDEQLRNSKFYLKTMDQAQRQSAAATDREVDWYFAEKRFSDFFSKEFDKYPNITVHHEDAVIKMFMTWLMSPSVLLNGQEISTFH
jgi:hypothetical protein